MCVMFIMCVMFADGQFVSTMRKTVDTVRGSSTYMDMTSIDNGAKKIGKKRMWAPLENYL